MKEFWKNILSRPASNTSCKIFLAALSSTAILFYCDVNIDKTFVLVMLTFLFFMLYKNVTIKKEQKNIFLLIFGAIFSILLVVGKAIYKTNDILSLYNSFLAMLKNITTCIGLFVAIYYFLAYVGSRLKTIDAKNSAAKEYKLWKFYNNKHIFLILFAIMFLSFIPAWLTHFPGIFTYDIPAQTDQALGGFSAIYALQPPIHTTIWMFCIKIANHTGLNALVIYELPQMLFMAYAFARFVKFLIDRKVNNYIILAAILWLTLNPVVNIFVLLCTKDVYFSGLLVLIMIELVEFLSKNSAYVKNKFRWIWFALLILLSCLFRNNMIYVFILTLIILLIVRRVDWKNVLKIFLVPIILYYAIIGPGYKMLGIGKGNPREMLSVPIQQIGMVVTNHYDELSEEELQAIDKYIPVEVIKKQYNMRLSDPVKDHFKVENFGEDKISFFKTYLKLLSKYPNDYISSFLTLNISYWYIDAKTKDPVSKYEYIENGMKHVDEYPIERTSVTPFLQPYYDDVSNYSLFEKIPFINTLFSVSFPVWVLLFSFVIMLYKKMYTESMVFMPMILLWMTYLLGPVSIFRYVFPIFVCYPLFVALLFNSKRIFRK